MKRRYYSLHDYQYSSLPATRKEAFKDVYRQNFSTIFKCGSFLLLSFLPLIVFFIIMEIGKMGMTLEHYSEDDLFGVLFLWDLIIHVGFIFLFIIVVLFLSGIFRVLKLLIFQEGIDFLYDFKRGIKENFKQFFLIYLIYTIIYLITYLLQLFFLRAVFGMALLFFFQIIFTPLLIWIYLSINIYDAKLISHIKNGFFFYFKNVLWSLLYLLFFDLIMLVTFLFYQNIIVSNINFIFILIKNVVLVFALLFLYPMLIIVSMLFSNSKFDLFINKDNFPEIYHKGLYDIKDKAKK